MACPDQGYWTLPEFAPNCAASDYDKAGSILHEMSKFSCPFFGEM